MGATAQNPPRRIDQRALVPATARKLSGRLDCERISCFGARGAARECDRVLDPDADGLAYVGTLPELPSGEHAAFQRQAAVTEGPAGRNASSDVADRNHYDQGPNAQSGAAPLR